MNITQKLTGLIGKKFECTIFVKNPGVVDIFIETEIKRLFPGAAYGIINCELKNSSDNKMLWQEIRMMQKEICGKYTLDTVKHQLNIAATRDAYKAYGGDPNRYRPSADSLYRRIVKGIDLYQISTLVDIINLVSLKTGYSIGGFDLDKVAGKVLVGIGRKGEAYEGIGRGELNIEGLPVIRDKAGPIGTPTSDHVRTAVSLETKRFYMHIYAYSGSEPLREGMDWAMNLLTRYVNAKNIEKAMIT